MLKNKLLDIDIIESIKNSYSISETLKKLNLTPTGARYAFIKQKVKEFKLDTSHWLGQSASKGKKRHNTTEIPLDLILVENSTYSNTHFLKKKLIKKNLLINKCYICNLTTWLDKSIGLQLDHINGNRTDNRIENLRILCPNCHAQTDTYCGKNSKLPDNFCKCGTKIQRRSKSCGRCLIKLPNSFSHHSWIDCKCGNKMKGSSKQCEICFNSNRSTKINWPSNQEILDMISKNSYLEISRKLGVSDNAIRKHLKRQGIEVPKKWSL